MERDTDNRTDNRTDNIPHNNPHTGTDRAGTRRAGNAVAHGSVHGRQRRCPRPVPDSLSRRGQSQPARDWRPDAVAAPRRHGSRHARKPQHHHDAVTDVDPVESAAALREPTAAEDDLEQALLLSFPRWRPSRVPPR